MIIPIGDKRMRMPYLIAAAVLCLGIGVGAVGTLKSLAFLRHNRKQLWSAERNSLADFPELRFIVLGFPTSDRLGETERRALIASWSELNSEKMEVFVKNSPIWIERSEWSVIPPADRLEQMVERLNDELVSWGAETDWSGVKAFVSGNEVTVRIETKARYTYVYRYEVLGEGNVVPKEFAIEGYRH